MSSRYLLRCECGNQIAIELGQAGQTIPCSCGRKLTVPSMRHIRQLPVDETPATVKPAKAWNPAKGAIFGLGCLLIICGLIITAYTYPSQSQYAAFKPSPEHFQESLNQIDQNTPEELWDLWHVIVSHGLGDHESSPFVFASKEAQRLWGVLIAGIAIAAVGVLLAIVSLVLPGTRHAPR